MNYRMKAVSLTGLMCVLLLMLQAQPLQSRALQTGDSTRFPQERIYVHTDKSQYLAGELVWFKAYLVDATTRRPSGISKVAYVEFLDQNNTPVLQAKIDMKEGVGAGSVILPLALKSGNYLLRAYTAWMKNFPSIHFFRQSLSIYNTMQPYRTDTTNRPGIRATFFPESGELVNNLRSTMGVQVVDAFGNGIDCSGRILDELDNEVAVFAAGNEGLGQFQFKPATGHRYKAMLQTATGLQGPFFLPSGVDTGFVLHVVNASPDLVIEIGGASVADRQTILSIHQAGLEIFTTPINFANSSASIRLPVSRLRDGVNTITLFNEDGRPVAERLLFRMPGQPLRLEAVTNQKSYAQREKVRVTIGSGPRAGLSASVYRNAPFASALPDIFTSLWLGSEMHGLYKPLASYLTGTRDSTATFDNLMLVFGYRKFLKEKQRPLVRFIPELEGHLVEGVVTNTRTGRPAANVMTYLTIPGPVPAFYTSESDSNGRILFVVKDNYGTNELIIQTDYRKDSTYKIDIRSPFVQGITDSVTLFRYDTRLADWLQQSALAVQVNNHFNETHIHTFYDRPVDSAMFYRKPTSSYLLDEYKRFTTMDEVLREYVPGVVVRKRNGRNEIDVANYAMKSIFEDPLLLIDGMPVFNSELLMKYDPLKVRKLEVINTRYVYGSAVFNGISSWQTYHGDLDGFTPDPRAVVVDYEGLQLQRQFYSPVYETNEQQHSRVPDYRTLLSWNPFLHTSADGSASFEFYTSDQPGHYEVVLQGMDANGKLGSAVVSFEVK